LKSNFTSNVTGKLILTGKLVLETPLIIGAGEKSDDVGIVILKDETGSPYIPATSLAGALRHYFFCRARLDQVPPEQLQYFWGADLKKEKEHIYQSAFSINDLHPENEVRIKIRDGLKIDNRLGIAEPGKKFDYELVEPGAVFGFEAEITLREAYDKKVFLQVIGFLVKALKERKVALGAMTTKGFGRCRLRNPILHDYDFSQKKAVIAWLNKDFKPGFLQKDIDLNNVLAEQEPRDFYLNAVFALQSSLVVRSYSGDPQAPDAVHLTSNGKDVLPGTSVKGALRSRAERIINTLGGQGEEMIKRLFGWAGEEAKSGEKYKSRVVVEETIIKNVTAAIQSRIKVDRFTGGVIKGALFDTMPLWAMVGEQEMVEVKVTIRNYQDWEAGLLLLILKDLWTGDLPIGGEKNIGRGVLKGRRAEIFFGGQPVIITSLTGNQLQIAGNKGKLEKLVAAFVANIRGEEAAYGKEQMAPVNYN